MIDQANPTNEAEELSAMQSHSDRPRVLDKEVSVLLLGSEVSRSWAQMFFTGRGEEFASYLQPYLSDPSLTPEQKDMVAEAIEWCRSEEKR